MRTIRIKNFKIGSLFAVSLSLTACASWLPEPHRIDIQQGNVITDEMKTVLKVGMTKAEVVNLLGDAILQDPFHPERWDYLYRLKSDKQSMLKSRLTLYFKDNRLISIDDKEFVAVDR